MVDAPNSELAFDRSWTKEIKPGHCFVWFSTSRLTHYSTVLPPPENKPGYLFTRTFTIEKPDGFDAFVRDDLPAKLLSSEQMRVARELGWPNDHDGIIRVFDVPES